MIVLLFQKVLLWHHDPQHEVEDQSTEGREECQESVCDSYHYGVKIQILGDTTANPSPNSVIRACQSLIHNPELFVLLLTSVVLLK